MMGKSRHIGILAGFALGILSSVLFVLLGHKIMPQKALHMLGYSKSELARISCTQQSQEDKLYFISCGGIY